MLEEGGQVSGKNVEANPLTNRNPNGLCEDAERIRTLHLKTIREGFRKKWEKLVFWTNQGGGV